MSSTPRENFLAALTGKLVTGRVPHFELVFYLTMEAFGMVHPQHRSYGQWDQMSETEKQLQREDMADVYIKTAEMYEHSAIYLHPKPGTIDEIKRLIEIIRNKSGDTYCLLLPGDPTYAIPNGENMVEFSFQMLDKKDELIEKAAERVENVISKAEALQGIGLDGFCLCSDYCFNTGPFMSPDQFDTFVTPFLKQTLAAYRDMGYVSIKHTDGNIMPILEQLADCKPDGLHSIDPQGGVDIKEVKKLIGDKITLCGNVSCAAMDTGTDEEVIESTEYCLEHGMPEGRYIFCTSNCIYTGMDLKRYDLMLKVWRKKGNYVS